MDTTVQDLFELFDLDPADPVERLGYELAHADTDLIDQLIAMRQQKGLRQQDIADKIGRTQAAVSNFERLGSDPRMSTVRRYALAVGARVAHQVVDAEIGDARTRTFKFPMTVVDDVGIVPAAPLSPSAARPREVVLTPTAA